MAITYNADTGLVADDVSTVRANVAELFKAAFATSDDLPELNTEPETPAGQLVDGITALLMEKDNEILYLANMFNPATASGVWQDALASIYFLNRIVKAATTVTCRCSGLYGTTIPAYSVVQDVEGHQLISQTAATIGEDSYVDIVFRCVDYGPIEIADGTVTKIITVIPGWDTVTNEAAGVTGRDSESQSSLEARRKECVAKNAHGTGDALLGTVAALDDVVAAALIQNRTDAVIEEHGVYIGPHSVYLSVYGGDVDEIAEAVYTKLDAGCGTTGNTEISHTDDAGTEHTYYITIPTTVDTGVAVTIRDTASLPTDYEDAIKTAVLSNFEGNDDSDNSRIKMCETLYASRFYKGIIATGVDELVSVKVIYPLSGGTEADSVEIPANELPVLSADNVTVTLLEGE